MTNIVMGAITALIAVWLARLHGASNLVAICMFYGVAIGGIIMNTLIEIERKMK